MNRVWLPSGNYQGCIESVGYLVYTDHIHQHYLCPRHFSTFTPDLEVTSVEAFDYHTASHFDIPSDLVGDNWYELCHVCSEPVTRFIRDCQCACALLYETAADLSDASDAGSELSDGAESDLDEAAALRPPSPGSDQEDVEADAAADSADSDSESNASVGQSDSTLINPDVQYILFGSREE